MLVITRWVALFILSVFARRAIAQQGFFVTAGYAWNWSGESNAPVRFLSPPRFGLPPVAWHDQWIEAPEGSFGTGQGAWVEAGYRLSERIGFSIAGRSVFAPGEQHYMKRLDMFGATAETIYTRKADKPFFLEPGVKVFLPLGNKAEAYFRMGVLLPIRHTILAHTYTPDTSGGAFWQTAAELRTSFGVGGFGGGGVTADLGSGFGLFIQGGFGLLSLRARDETVLALVFANGDNVASQLSEAERVIEYGDDFVQTLGAPPGLSSKQPSYLVPFNFWSVELGVRWALTGD